MPLGKRSYAFKEPEEENENSENKHPSTPLSKIKTRGRSFIGSKTPTRDKAQEDMPFLSPFLRSSVRLKSFRKRKMANRDESQVDGSYNKKVFMADKCKDEIEEKIEENIRMRDGIMKLITGCHDAKQAVDISKNLLTINSRVLSLMSSLQKKRSTTILKDYNQRQSKIGVPTNDKESCLAEVCISDIRIPLMWKSDSHFKTKVGELPTLLYHMFCLFKIGDQVYDTPLIQFNQIDTDVTFEDLYIFHDVPADFKLDVEVYYTVMHNPDNPAWTPIRSQKKSVYDSAPKYCLAAHSQLSADNIKDGFLTSDFTMGSKGASATAVLGQVDDLPENPLALWGQFSCYLRAKPSCMLKDAAEGNVYLQTSNGGQPVWEKYFCRLRHCTIQGWKHFPEQEEAFTMEPGMSIKIKGNMEVRVEKSQFTDKNVLILTSSDVEKEPVMSFDNADDLDKWYQALTQLIIDSKSWKLACENPMEFETMASKRNLLIKPTNFYDQINIEQNDVRPKSPRSVKKSIKPFSRIPESNSKRSFYDLINIDEKVPEAVESGITIVVNGDLSNEKTFEMETERDSDGESALQNSKLNKEECKEQAEQTSTAVKMILPEPIISISSSNHKDEHIELSVNEGSAEEGLRACEHEKSCEQEKEAVINKTKDEESDDVLDVKNSSEKNIEMEVVESAGDISSVNGNSLEEILRPCEHETACEHGTEPVIDGSEAKESDDVVADVENSSERNVEMDVIVSAGDISSTPCEEGKALIDDEPIVEDNDSGEKDNDNIMLNESRSSESGDITECGQGITEECSKASIDLESPQENYNTEMDLDSKHADLSSDCEENVQREIPEVKPVDNNEFTESQEEKESSLLEESEEITELKNPIESDENLKEINVRDQSELVEDVVESGKEIEQLEDMGDKLEKSASEDELVDKVESGDEKELVDNVESKDSVDIVETELAESLKQDEENVRQSDIGLVSNESLEEVSGNEVEEEKGQDTLSAEETTLADVSSQNPDTETDRVSNEAILSEANDSSLVADTSAEKEQSDSETNQDTCEIKESVSRDTQQQDETICNMQENNRKIETDV